MTFDQSDFREFREGAEVEDDRGIRVVHVSEPYDTWGARNARGQGMGERMPPHKGWLGNPFRKEEYGRQECISRFRAEALDVLRESPVVANAFIAQTGHRVACYCRHSDEDEPACHLDVVDELLRNGMAFGIAKHRHEIPLSDQQEELAKSPKEIINELS
jgi:hypothetical protein